MKVDKNGTFVEGDFRATPFQHHQTKWQWTVCVRFHNDIERISIVAQTAIEAASAAIKQYPEIKKDQVICKLIAEDNKRKAIEAMAQEDCLQDPATV